MKLVILGYGAAGFAAMIKANELGVKPVLIGSGPLGGTCVNVGCVPSKTLLHEGEIAKQCGKNADFSKSMEIKNNIVEEMRKKKYEDVLSSYDVELVEGKAHFISPKAVKVGDKVVEGDKFIIATGSSPSIPDIPGLREVGFWTNVEALSSRKVNSLIVVGGRALGVEFAQMYARMGIDVALLQRSPVLLPDWEPEVSIEARNILEDDGVVVATNVRVKEVRKGLEKVVVTDKGEVEADEILMATGRKPNVDLNLKVAGVSLNDRGGVKVNDALQTSNPNVYAAGDVIGEPMLEAVAGREGSLAAENAITGSRKGVDFLSVPRAVFVQPNIASVGLREMDVPQAESRKVMMKDIAKGRIVNSRGFIKMVTQQGRVMGVSMVGENAADVINEAALAIKMRVTVDDLIDTIHLFPTMGEAIRIAAISFRGDVQRMSCCV
ncbi:mercury(II) reductase [Sulfuracidifex tepidarius]|uniref:Mercuric reductase n=1 Tax=Sulfuracidifex tepidarius TaxID=1294262 RepID=A0A510E077_9CREN|nr:mercury(II) reductase [Sulfuracidifex tepidarius]BBG25889.1 Dihydrolipoyl dehydrogenase [Sulfuracidifex tepidarius]